LASGSRQTTASNCQGGAGLHLHPENPEARQQGDVPEVSRNPSEAKRWFRQAVDDHGIARHLLKMAEHDGKTSCWVCFTSRAVAELALKAAMYATCGLSNECLKDHGLKYLALELARMQGQLWYNLSASRLPHLVETLEPYYLDTRFPDRWWPQRAPSDCYDLKQAKEACEIADKILCIVRGIIEKYNI